MKTIATIASMGLAICSLASCSRVEVPAEPLADSIRIENFRANVSRARHDDDYIKIRVTGDITNVGSSPVTLLVDLKSQAHLNGRRFLSFLLHNAGARDPPLVTRYRSTPGSKYSGKTHPDGMFIDGDGQAIGDLSKFETIGSGITCEPGSSIPMNDGFMITIAEWRRLRPPLAFSFLAIREGEDGIDSHWFQTPAFEFDEPADAPESASRGSSKMDDQPRGPGDR